MRSRARCGNVIIQGVMPEACTNCFSFLFDELNYVIVLGRKSNDKKHYKAHVRGCHDPRYKNVRFYCQFPGCICKYKRKNDLRKHMREVHP